MRPAAGLDPEDPLLNTTCALERFGIGGVPLVALVSDVPGAVNRLTVLHEAGHLIFDRDLAGPVEVHLATIDTANPVG